jgi:hypothetical protein
LSWQKKRKWKNKNLRYKKCSFHSPGGRASNEFESAAHIFLSSKHFKTLFSLNSQTLIPNCKKVLRDLLNNFVPVDAAALLFTIHEVLIEYDSRFRTFSG